MQIAVADDLYIYGALYNHVASRLQTALPGSSLPMTLPASLYTVSIIPTHTDLAAVDQFSDPLTFLQTAYWGLLGRLPTESEIRHWTTESTHGQLRRDVLCSLLGSAEFSGRHITVSNIPAYAHVPPKAKVFRILRTLYNHLPLFLRSGMRDLYHQGKELIKRG